MSVIHEDDPLVEEYHVILNDTTRIDLLERIVNVGLEKKEDLDLMYSQLMIEHNFT